ncbi:MAG: hypothetical protein ACREJG_07435 [Candidatus Rokuibacteriota bacterium]
MKRLDPAAPLPAYAREGDTGLDLHAAASGEITTLATDLGRLDGVYPMDDGTLHVTDWSSASLARWSAKGGWRAWQRISVVVPDLVKSELRMIRLSR